MKTTTTFQVYSKSGYNDSLKTNDDPNDDFGLYPPEVYKEYERKKKEDDKELLNNQEDIGLYPPSVE